MTDGPEARPATRALAYPTLVLNILVSLAWVALTFAFDGSLLYDSIYAVPVLSIVTLVPAVLDLVIGRWGGQNRTIGIVGGCILAAPLALTLLATVISFL